jgi:hypothetical protein
MGGLLAGVDHRLKAYVLSTGGGGMVSFFTDPERRGVWNSLSEYTRRRWVEWMWPIEPIHYIGCASPAALLFLNGTLDPSSTPADALRYQEAASEPKTIYWYQASHGLNPSAVHDQMEWLAEMIGISAGPLALPANPQLLAEYAGRYQHPNGVNFTIRIAGTRVFLQIPNEPPYEQYGDEFELFLSSKDHFVGQMTAEIAFYRNASGEVDRLVWVENGVTVEMKKVP